MERIKQYTIVENDKQSHVIIEAKDIHEARKKALEMINVEVVQIKKSK